MSRSLQQDFSELNSPQLGPLERGLQLVEVLVRSKDSKLVELASELHVSRPTAFRLLKVLERYDLVQHSNETHTYCLGPAWALVADGTLAARLAARSMHSLRLLEAHTGETTALALLSGRKLTYHLTLPGRCELRSVPVVGAAVPLHSSALGKAILARLSPEQLHAFLGNEPFEKFTPCTRVTLRSLRQDLARTQVVGYAVDNQESEAGLVCAAVALTDTFGNPVAAISVSGPSSRLTKSHISKLGSLLVATCLKSYS